MPVTPFIILALPRSRTAWLSRFLAYSDRKVGHDIAIGCSSVNGFAKALDKLTGTVETGMAEAWYVLMRRFPQARMVVIRRDTDEVLASLAKQGVTGVDEQIRARADALDQFSRRTGITTIRYPALADPSVCAWLFQYCTGLNHDPGWWSAWDRTNVQIDVAQALATVAANAEGIAKFKAEVKRQVPKTEPHDGAIVALEPFGSIWPECDALGRAHFEEVETETDPRRPFTLDRMVLSQISVQGFLHVITARIEGKLIGYLFWTLHRDPESLGLLMADQGPWYVTSDAPPRTALRMYTRSIAEMKRLGVKMLYPHHRTVGRGSGLGKFFQRHGAVPEKQVYSLWIGD